MKFSCTQENLRLGLVTVSHVASKHVNLPILGNVLIKADNNMLRLMATNLEIAIQCIVRGKIDEPGEFTVPSKVFADYLTLLPNDRVDVSLDGTTLAVSCGKHQTKLNGIVATEFPLIPTVERKNSFILNVNDFRRMLSQVVFAVAPNESRPEISGVLFKFIPNGNNAELVMAATDSYRLSERIVPIAVAKSSAINEQFSVIVPARTVMELLRILSLMKDDIETPEEITLIVSDNQIVFAYNSMEMMSRLIEGRYPDYRQLIPENFATQVTFDKNDLIRAVKTTSLFSRTGINDVNLKFLTNNSVVLSAGNTQIGEHSGEIGAKVTGKENSVTVNFKYLLDGLNACDDLEISLNLVDSMSPCILRNTGVNSKNGLYIVMPIRQ